MFIFLNTTRRTYVAGVFNDATIGDFSAAMHYLRVAPAGDAKWSMLRVPLIFPFYIAEYTTGAKETLASTFSFHQNELDAAGGDIVYTITEGYVPSTAWNDEMGNLPHEHTNDDYLEEFPP